jgi:membrane protease YdiL (CAAX protease family)
MLAAALGIAVLLLERAGAGTIPTPGGEAEKAVLRRFYWPLAAGFCLFHPAVDEYYWRWFVFGNLRRLLDPRAAHLLAAAVFGAHHVITGAAFLGPARALLVGVVCAAAGLVWSLLYAGQKTLAGAWASHFVLELGITVLFHRVLFGGWG